MTRFIVATAILTIGVLSTASSAETQDITNLEFSQMNANCASYIASYKSSVKDINENKTYSGSIIISLDGDKCIFKTNAIPNHDFNDGERSFHNKVREQSTKYSVTTTPKFAASAIPLSIEKDNAIFLNGVKLDLLAAACYDVGKGRLGTEKSGCAEPADHPWRYDPISPLNNFSTDSHDAHAQGNGAYHYHSAPKVLFDSRCESINAASVVIGFAADGFPIYSSCINDNGTVRKVTSSYGLKTGTRQPVAGFTTPDKAYVASANYDGQFLGDYEYKQGSGDLDQCNGMTVNGQYGYYATDSYPWVLSCFSGTPDESFNKRQR